jgi:hypothetical protein
VPQKSRNVGAADSSDLDGNFFFAFLRFRTGTLFQFNPAGSGIDQCLHRPKYKAPSSRASIALLIFLTGLRVIPIVFTGYKNEVEFGLNPYNGGAGVAFEKD